MRDEGNGCGEGACENRSPVIGIPESHPGNFFENIGANLCNLMTSGHQK